MIKLDDNLLAELGLHTLPPEEKKALLRHIYETLEMRVGTTLARQMTDAQLDEFESFINNNDEAGALRWLETNFPNYKDVVSQEFDALKQEVRAAAPQIMASASQAHHAPQAPVPTDYGQQPYPQQPQGYPQAPAGYPAAQHGQTTPQHPGYGAAPQSHPQQPPHHGGHGYQQPQPGYYNGQQPPQDQDHYGQAA